MDQIDPLLGRCRFMFDTVYQIGQQTGIHPVVDVVEQTGN